jgi:hypothetical protein
MSNAAELNSDYLSRTEFSKVFAFRKQATNQGAKYCGFNLDHEGQIPE